MNYSITKEGTNISENLDKLPGIARRREKERKKQEEARKDQKSEYLLKISIIGSNFELRDKLIRSYSGGVTDPYAMTLGTDMTTKKIAVKDTKTKLILVNTHDQKSFDQLRPRHYRGTSACIITFNTSDRKSFEKVTYWLEDFRNYIPSPDLPFAILGIDTGINVYPITTEEGKAFAEELNFPYFETSYPKFRNCPEIFEYLAKQVIK